MFFFIHAFFYEKFSSHIICSPIIYVLITTVKKANMVYETVGFASGSHYQNTGFNTTEDIFTGEPCT